MPCGKSGANALVRVAGMTPTLLTGPLVTAALARAALMWFGVSGQNYPGTVWSAAAFAAFAVITSFLVNRSFWKAQRDGEPLAAIRTNALLAAIIYAWGGLAMFVTYKLTDLYWQHGLQYAIGMAAFAALFIWWHRESRPGGRLASAEWVSRSKILNLVHGGAAAIATVVFLASGKLWADRPDWAANLVFLAGGVSIAALCAFSAVTNAKLKA